MFTMDEIRVEAIQAVQALFIQWGLRPAEQQAPRAWSVLALIAGERPQSRVGQYYWYSGEQEQHYFMALFEEWKQLVNGAQG